jgi:uncharacterized protein YsxB (DUF464 family)
MIKAVFYLRKQDVIGYEITGHAHFAIKGSDIVCAAVSVLSQAITAELNNAVLNDCEGISVRLIEPNVRNRVLCETLIHGLKQIEEQYPKNLKVDVYETRN